MAGKTYFSFNYDVTQLHHISLVEMIFLQNESGKRTGIFRLKTVLSNTAFSYGYKNYAKEYPGKKQPNTQQIPRIVRKSE